MATLGDVAQRSGYAVSTVSHVLNNHASCYASKTARAAIREAAEALGYRPHFFARSLRRLRSFQVGVVGSLFGSEINALQMRSLVDPLRAAGYGILFSDTMGELGRERAAIDDLLYKCVEGILLQSYSDGRELKKIVPDKTPCVLLVERPVPGALSLVIDRAMAVETAVQLLLRLGHRRIAFLADRLAPNSAKAEGYRRAMKNAGVLDENLLLECTGAPGCARDFVTARAALFGTTTAIVATNDRLAAEAIVGLRRIGMQVPDDISVIGFDDTDIVNAVEPPLTTLRQPRAEVGKVGAQMLLDCIAGRQVENTVLVPQLVERGSVAPCRRAL